MRHLNIYASSTGAIFGAQPENYGDNLMAPILQGLFNIDPKFVPMVKAELIGIGSIADSYHRRRKPAWKRLLSSLPRRNLHVWGSGFMNESGEATWPQRVTFHAVRGPLSLKKTNLPSLPLGDPALLLPSIWPRPQVDAEVAIVPHFATFRTFVDNHRNALPKHWRIVNLLDEPEDVTKQIAGAEIVVSSSLHGLIVADAYDIPAIRMTGDNRIKGDGFKYRDYEAFRGESYGPPVAPDGLWQSKLMPKPARSPNADQMAGLLKAFPFA